MQIMKFSAPIGCRNEVFSTCRLGDKWKTRVKAGCREVDLQDTEGRSIGKGEITDIWFGPLSLIPAIFLESYHDPVSRTWSGLHACLQGIYDHPVLPTDEVTVMRIAYRGEATSGPALQVATAADVARLNKKKPESFGGRG